jgi:hypothetical protein
MNKRLVTPLLVALVIAAGAIGSAQAVASAPAVDDALTCNGGAQEQALTVSDDQATTMGEYAAGFTPLFGAEVPFNVPMGDTDQIIVTFSAEAILGGQTTPLTVPTDSIQLQILLDGVPMFPLDDLNFTTDAGHANAIEACKRVPAGAHTVTVEWFLFDQGVNNVLTGTLDDWTLHVEINN